MKVKLLLHFDMLLEDALFSFRSEEPSVRDETESIHLRILFGLVNIDFLSFIAGSAEHPLTPDLHRACEVESLADSCIDEVFRIELVAFRLVLIVNTVEEA